MRVFQCIYGHLINQLQTPRNYITMFQCNKSTATYVIVVMKPISDMEYRTSRIEQRDICWIIPKTHLNLLHFFYSVRPQHALCQWITSSKTEHHWIPWISLISWRSPHMESEYDIRARNKFDQRLQPTTNNKITKINTWNGFVFVFFF